MIRTIITAVSCSAALAYILAAGMAVAQTKCTTHTLTQGGSPSAPTVKVCVESK
jgi:hypothetical protein